MSIPHKPSPHHSTGEEKLVPEGIDIKSTDDRGEVVRLTADDSLREIQDVIAQQRQRQGIPEDPEARRVWLEAERKKNGTAKPRTARWRQ